MELDEDGEMERLQWEDDDIDFYFNQAEIKMTANGVKNNYTTSPGHYHPQQDHLTN